MKVLIGCENSGVTREAFLRQGFDAYSCDLLPSDQPSDRHIQGDLRDIVSKVSPTLLIAHPDCTYLCVSGIHWNDRGRGWEETDKALEFVKWILDLDVPHIALENPVGLIGSRIRKADQYIQPYEFGHNASKKTGLWLKNLPKLQPTSYIEPRIVDGKRRWDNQTDSGQNRLAPSADRWKLRSKTYSGWANAMVDQWSHVLINKNSEDRVYGSAC